MLHAWWLYCVILLAGTMRRELIVTRRCAWWSLGERWEVVGGDVASDLTWTVFKLEAENERSAGLEE